MLMTNNKVFMGSLPPSWESNKNIKYITFSVTDDCNLRCTYCYFTHKTCKNVMSIEIAKEAVDDILEESMYDSFDGVVWDFIGGEPTLEMDLISDISDYILYKMYVTNHKWLYKYRFMIGTNGLLYRSKKVQDYISKHYGNVYFAITIDGSKEKHDKSRKKPDGSGSYDDVRKIIPLWQKQFGGDTTKATFSHDDLPYLKDSIINLWEMGIKSVAANVVFENSWSTSDPQVFKEQLYALADYIIENDLWDKYSVRFFDPVVGTPYTEQQMRRNRCGTGKMMAINTNGDYYPCVRFMPSAMNNNTFKKLGSTKERISSDRIRAFYALDTRNQSSAECLKCDIAGGCAWCSGLNYDESSIGTLYERQTFICEMHKANVEVNKYLWRKYELIKHKVSPYRYLKLTTINSYNKFLYILGSNKLPSFCNYKVPANLDEVTMTNDLLIEAIDFCERNNMIPIFYGFKNLPDDYYGYQIVPYNNKWDIQPADNYLQQVLIDIDDINESFHLSETTNIILTYAASKTNKLQSCIELVKQKMRNVNINLIMNDMDINPKEFLIQYSELLKWMKDCIIGEWKKHNYLFVNILTNELFANNNRFCGAGWNSYTLSPDGNFYLCPGFYYTEPESKIGDITTGINNKYTRFCDMNRAPLCEKCSVRHCERCVYDNRYSTGELHIPSEFQCVKSGMEYEFSRRLSELLKNMNFDLPFGFNKNIKLLDEYDPMVSIRSDNYPNQGYNETAKTILTPQNRQ